MSVLIRGMEMPKGCDECQLTTQYYDGGMDVCCPLDKYVLPSGSKRDDCPLVEIPPHGRLIDADALEKEAQKRMLICSKYDKQFQKPYEIMSAIALAPTIIEAEEGE